MIILPSAKGFPLKPALIKDPYYSSVTALLHMSGANGSTAFIDNSPNGYTVTRLGNPTISTAQSKFNNGSAIFSYGSYMLYITMVYVCFYNIYFLFSKHISYYI